MISTGEYVYKKSGCNIIYLTAVFHWTVVSGQTFVADDQIEKFQYYCIIRRKYSPIILHEQWCTDKLQERIALFSVYAKDINKGELC